MEEAEETPLDPVEDPKVYIKNDLTQIVAQAVTEARPEEQAKAQRQLVEALAEVRRQYKEETAATNKARMENMRWQEQQMQQVEADNQRLRERDSVSAQNAFAQPLNQAAISALSEQQVVELYRQFSELSRLISPRVENALQQYARRELIDSATDDETHEADNEAPPSRFGTIRKKPGKKLLEGLKILGRSGTQKGKEKRGSSIGDTFARFKSIIKSTLGSDKSTDDTDTAVTDESSAASPFKSTHMPSHDTQEPPTTPIHRPSTDVNTMRARRKLSKKSLKMSGLLKPENQKRRVRQLKPA
ncbi:hypothetical protein PV05_09158 [Exophiala xenobiotica]|uniref:Uncharacterized protein n=1 Tax=Exophiala xenobiotica TaxID=348802 RepID=A0A0D2EE01_9EURO|nr:uncharacterized protein PV05_09158 [Exophiala xenobiotica]KIW53603.1 hypothetical protein PV05_09158 [Exophiala xenobiotica]